jgi:hypothetical protein
MAEIMAPDPRQANARRLDHERPEEPLRVQRLAIGSAEQ